MTLDNDEVEKISPKRKENPDNVRRVEFILTDDNFEELFPRRHRSYTYTRLLQVFYNFLLWFLLTCILRESLRRNSFLQNLHEKTRPSICVSTCDRACLLSV